MKRCFLIVLDGVGVGELPDADGYGDCGSATLPNVAETVGGLSLPNLERLGLGNIVPIKGVSPTSSPRAVFGKLRERSSGKDSTTGHWELAGVITSKPFPLYPEGFPEDIIGLFIDRTGCGDVLGNRTASGTEIIARLGKQHIDTGYPIVYTSADSVFQIAAHEDIVPLERLYQWCTIARNEVMVGDHEVSRIIARPFIGEPGAFKRSVNRKDFSVEPKRKTLLDHLTESGIATVTIGKVDNLFAGRGVGRPLHTKNNTEGIRVLIDVLKTFDSGFVFTNLVDFDQEYGHRNDPHGFARALMEFDNAIPGLLGLVRDDDLIIVTSDHGNDPTVAGSDHTREYALLLAIHGRLRNGREAGTRDSFADVAQTCAEHLAIPAAARNHMDGLSFYTIFKTEVN
jgi:phosphopentomutase